jgi:hypothetical protein
MYDDDGGANDVIYVPTWMFLTLSDPTQIQVTECERHPCTKIKFRPYQSEFTSIPEWNANLATALRNYGSLTQNTTIPIQIDASIIHITVDALAPLKYKTCMLIKDSCVDIEFTQLPAAVDDDDAESSSEEDDDPMKRCQYLVFPGRNRKKKKVKKYTFKPFMCPAHTFAETPLPDVNRTPQSMSHEAALRRLAAEAVRGIPTTAKIEST